jgi:Asp-tRNA(Asn)/Glu-tRNA(Gln) amidotransferase A subunit family amidase
LFFKAFFNGVYGHKPSPRMVNNQKQFPRSQGFYRERLSCAGPLCRYASDLRLLLKIQADKDRYADIADKMEKKVCNHEFHDKNINK